MFLKILVAKYEITPHTMALKKAMHKMMHGQLTKDASCPVMAKIAAPSVGKMGPSMANLETKVGSYKRFSTTGQFLKPIAFQINHNCLVAFM